MLCRDGKRLYKTTGWNVNSSELSNPTPRKGESEKEYVAKFMGDAEAVRDYPDVKQRCAVAHNWWKEKQNMKNASDEAVSGYTLKNALCNSCGAANKNSNEPCTSCGHAEDLHDRVSGDCGHKGCHCGQDEKGQRSNAVELGNNKFRLYAGTEGWENAEQRYMRLCYRRARHGLSQLLKGTAASGRMIPDSWEAILKVAKREFGAAFLHKLEAVAGYVFTNALCNSCGAAHKNAVELGNNQVPPLCGHGRIGRMLNERYMRLCYRRARHGLSQLLKGTAASGRMIRTAGRQF